jgi:lysophospholipase L1-like esterase
MVYGYIGMLTFVFYKLFSRQSSNLAMNSFLIMCGVVFALLILEVFLSISGSYKTYMEKISVSYSSPYKLPLNNPYHVWPIGSPHWLDKPEYRYIRNTNSLGFGDNEWTSDKKPYKKRILALGDSFTEGDGAPYDSSYVSILRQILSTSGDTFYVMNAGSCGSDPFLNYMNLKDRLLVYKPDIVIQSIGSDDLNSDILLRGGFERFQKDGSIKYNPGPWWEPIYAINYVSRIFFRLAGYNEMLRNHNINAIEERRITKSVNDLLTRYSTLCKDNSIRLIIVIHPDRSEVEHNAYNYDFSHLNLYGPVTKVDLLPSYRAYIDSHHSLPADYYWKKDGHHNSKGYQMMAETTLQNIAPLLYDSMSNVH